MLATEDQTELINLFQQLRVFMRIHEMTHTEKTVTFSMMCALHEMKGEENPAVLAYKELADGFDPDTIMKSAEEFRELSHSIARRKMQ